MNRRQKIIISVTGIFLVLLLLVGLTYAYFLTKISGNTNTKSISVSTANLALVYGNDNGNVIGENELIEPGTTFDDKTFTVTNEGNATTDYVVVIEDVNVTYTSTVQVDGETHTAGSKTTFTSNDFVYTLTCTSGCNGVDTETTFPITGGILVGNNIEVGATQTYELSMKYLETGIDQSADMNKTLTAKLNIKDIGTLNPYSSNTNSLAYNIINNSVVGTNGTTLKAVTDTNVAAAVSTASEKVLSVTSDDYGTSYYYRGNVTDNYVNFAGMCWRIVRIAGDGSVKMTLAAQKSCSEITSSDTGTAFIGTGNYGYDSTTGIYKMSYLKPVTEKNKSMVKSFYDFQINKLADYTSKLKPGDWCYDDTVTETSNFGYDDNYNRVYTESEATNGWYTFKYYGAYTRIEANKKPSLNCTGTKLDKFETVEGVSQETPMYVSTLTIDEIVYAGGKEAVSNTNYYLNKNAIYDFWWTLSPIYSADGNDTAFFVYDDGKVMEYGVYYDAYSFRPAVSLTPSAQITSGDGTKNNPYIVE